MRIHCACCKHDAYIHKIKQKKNWFKLPHKCDCKYCKRGRFRGILKKKKSVKFKDPLFEVHEYLRARSYRMPQRKKHCVKRKLRGNKNKKKH